MTNRTIKKLIRESASFITFKREGHTVDKHKKTGCIVKPHQRAGYRVRGYIRGDMQVPEHERSGSVVYYRKKK